MPVDPIAWLFGLEQFGIKLGLDNIRTLLAALDNPERTFKSAHVAGTNGKGSVTAMLDAILRAAGHRTARYTSPHLVDLRERFVVDGAMVSEPELIDVVASLKAVVEGFVADGRLATTPTFFEVTTAAGFQIFRRAGVTHAVCEVGLGGRLDATNVLQPVVTAITSIAFDHERHLGRTLAEIAREKAGIIKAGPVVIGRLGSEARAVIDEAASRAGALVIDAAAEVHIVHLPQDGGGHPWAPLRIRMRTPVRDYGSITLGLRGAHQIANAAVAVRMAETFDLAGSPIPAEAIVEGLESVTWPGRIDLRRCPDGRELLLDAAHNPEGAAALAAYLEHSGAAPQPLVFAAMQDKNIADMLRALLPFSSRLIVTRASNARSEDPATIADTARALAPAMPIAVEPAPARALELAWQSAPSIVVAGSIFLLGDVVKHLEAS